MDGTDPCVEFRVKGEVQGVGYRYFTVREARRLGVRGFVRNLPDGSVQVVAQAPRDVLALLEQSLSVGPRHAVVESVERVELQGEDHHAFDVRY